MISVVVTGRLMKSAERFMTRGLVPGPAFLMPTRLPGHEANLTVGHARFRQAEHRSSSPTRRRAFLRPSQGGARPSDPVLTTNTNVPCWPACTAVDGTTTARGFDVSVTFTLTNWPGQRRAVGVRERALDLDGAGGWIDGVVDEVDAARRRRPPRRWARPRSTLSVALSPCSA